MAITDQQVAEAETRMAALRDAGHVLAARYDTPTNRIVISLNTGLDLVFPPSLAEGLAGADAAGLSRIEISASGLGLHWPTLDADLYVPGLLQGQFGSRHWMAPEMGGQGGAGPVVRQGRCRPRQWTQGRAPGQVNLRLIPPFPAFSRARIPP